MVAFFDLPRELRDLIYTEVVFGKRPRPMLGHPQWRSFRFQRVAYSQSGDTGEFGCAYSLEPVPPTCASFLCCNRQIHTEMMEMIDLVKKIEGDTALSARIDCIAEDESFHYFTWLSVPLVHTRTVDTHSLYARLKSGNSFLPNWALSWLHQYREWAWARLLLHTSSSHHLSTTHIERLCIDVRPTGDRTRKWTRNSSQEDRTSWAICAALNRLLENGPDFTSSVSSSSTLRRPRTAAAVPVTDSTDLPLTIAELTLNVIPPPNYPTSKFLPSDAQGNEVREGLVHPHSVAKELIDVWTRIWHHGDDDYKLILYRGLLERIGTVKVCVDGKLWGTRPLGDELRRGRRRFAR
ncbi:unnamed protein product [Periconia digitata]|uniref:Uncharacterized protein n=1 Tax=Periconia digitata TaxID=1303443 RepID=A0A9W4UJP7_9PLEO|nr:unnamed protein product [Periconia digitata]